MKGWRKGLFVLIRGLLEGVWTVVYFRRVKGRHKVPKEGGAILVCNHISLLDPVTVQLSTSRPMHFMAKKELFKNKALAWLIRSFRAFPVDRTGGDVTAVRKALSIVKGGDLLFICPEGTRHHLKNGKLGPLEPGVAFLALRADVPVIPAYIKGPCRVFSGMEVSFGDAVDLSDFRSGKLDQQTLSEASKVISRAMEALRPAKWIEDEINTQKNT